jgi:hypothetical protein
MRVKLAILADGANVSREGKLNILGVFDTIYSRQFPTSHPHMQLVLRFEASAEEAGSSHQTEVQLVAQDGQVLLRLPGAVTVHRRELGEAVGIDQILALANVRFQEPGRYTIRIAVDGVVAATLPLRVEEIPAQH